MKRSKCQKCQNEGAITDGIPDRSLFGIPWNSLEFLLGIFHFNFDSFEKGNFDKEIDGKSAKNSAPFPRNNKKTNKSINGKK
jgi:hypothetical protein